MGQHQKQPIHFAAMPEQITFTINDHRLAEATFVPSPNFGERPDPTDIDLLVIHNISLPPGQFGTEAVTDFFTNRLDASAHPYFESIAELKVSSHLFIKRDGKVIQFVPFNKRAWHAGKSCFQGRDNCNDFSIGVELEGTDDVPYDDRQYAALAGVTQCLVKHYPGIRNDRITGHENIAPGRKTDPGPSFSWDYYHSLLLGV